MKNIYRELLLKEMLKVLNVVGQWDSGRSQVNIKTMRTSVAEEHTTSISVAIHNMLESVKAGHYILYEKK